MEMWRLGVVGRDCSGGCSICVLVVADVGATRTTIREMAIKM